MTERLSFPQWMTAVNNAITDIHNRFHLLGMSPPPMPAVGHASYALYVELDPKVAAAILVRDGMMAQSMDAARGFPLGG
jgi:hypothetical protein